MSQENYGSMKITGNDLAEINAAMSTLVMKLLPYLKSLGAVEHAELPGRGDKTAAFVHKAMEYCAAHPELAGGVLDIEAFKRQVHTAESLRGMHGTMLQFTGAVNNAMTLVGSDALSAALVFYNLVVTAKQTGMENADAIYEDLSARFPVKYMKQ
jgi:hypothetical protein